MTDSKKEYVHAFELREYAQKEMEDTLGLGTKAAFLAAKEYSALNELYQKAQDHLIHWAIANGENLNGYRSTEQLEQLDKDTKGRAKYRRKFCRYCLRLKGHLSI